MKANALQKRKTFNFKLGVFLFFLIGAAGFLIWKIQDVSPADRKNYETLLLQSSSSNTSHKQLIKAKQEKEQIQKDLFFKKEGHSLQVRILADKAELVFDQNEKKGEVLEKFYQMKCIMQEEIYYRLKDGRELLPKQLKGYLVKNSDPKQESSWIAQLPDEARPMQVLRVFEADEALYFHKENILKARDVNIYRHVVEGHQLHPLTENAEPLLKGVAERVECELKGSEPHFEAFQLKMSLYKGAL